MNHGYFDGKNKEYVITNPATPQSWSNYLGSTEYGAVITNNAGGYGFYKSGARGRFMRLRFNSVPMDQPGRYFYITDKSSGDYWSTSWQPVGKDLKEYRSVCRHGTAYSIFESEYKGIKSEVTYFVPLGQLFEYWKVKIVNNSDRPRQLSVMSYCEFSNNWDTFQDQVNLQYSIFINQGMFENNFLRVAIQDNLSSQDSDNENIINDMASHAWMTLVGTKTTGYETSRDAFLGPYRSYHNPVAAEKGECSNSTSYGDNACGTLQTIIELQPGESREFVLMLGIGDSRTKGEKLVKEYGSLESCNSELEKLKKSWHQKLGNLIVETPDEEFNHTVNVWGLYNCLITYAWSRAASLVYNGERDGLGFRDSVQDILGITAAIPGEAGERLELLLTGQLANGGAIPVIKPFEHKPGQEKEPDKEEYRSDDCLWFFNAIPTWVAETGNIDFYHKVLPFADKGEAPVLGHLRRALEFNLERTGKNGLPCGLSADWNDCLNLGYYGESLFVAFQLRLGLSVYGDICEMLDKPEEKTWALKHLNLLDEKIQKKCWDGRWFIWAVGEDGTVYGTKEYEEGQVYLNTQVWSVLSEAATKEQAFTCMETVNKKLATPYGIMLCAPPFRKTSIDVMRAVVFNPGVKENAGIFNHTQGWVVMAECKQGNGNRAYNYYRSFMPAAYNDKTEIRQLEPYVQGQTTYSKYSNREGNCRTSWLTGAAPWAYYSAVQAILGIKPEYGGLRIDPCIPDSWPGFKAVRKFRGKEINIKVINRGKVCRGVTSIKVNGNEHEGCVISFDKITDKCQVEVVLG